MPRKNTSTDKKAALSGGSAKNSRKRSTAATAPKPAIPKPVIPVKSKKDEWVLKGPTKDFTMKPGSWPTHDAFKEVFKTLPDKNQACYLRTHYIVSQVEKIINEKFPEHKDNFDGLKEVEWKKIESWYNDLTKDGVHQIKFPMCERGFASKYSKAKLDLRTAVGLIPNKTYRAANFNCLRSKAAIKAGGIRSEEIKERKKEAAAAAAKQAEGNGGADVEADDDDDGDDDGDDYYDNGDDDDNYDNDDDDMDA